MVGQSPLEQQNEVVWLVTTERPNGLFYIAFVAPEQEYNQLQTQYQNMLRPISFH